MSERESSTTAAKVTNSLLHEMPSSLSPDALLGSPGNAGQPLEGPLQSSAIRPGGVEILVVIVLLKFLYKKKTRSFAHYRKEHVRGPAVYLTSAF
jgi:hypothetical protein